MNDHNVIFADPFGGKAATLPKDARLACAYAVFVQFEWFFEAAYFRRTDKTDELWVGEGDVVPAGWCDADGAVPSEDSMQAALSSVGCAFTKPREGDEFSSCLGLLELLIRARQRFCWPDGFIAPGIVDDAEFGGLVERIRKEFEENRQKARGAETEIIQVARELGLHPEPTGDGPGLWSANCPEKQHRVLIDAEKDLFFCGYCGRKGSARELPAFVEERRAATKPGHPTC